MREDKYRRCLFLITVVLSTLVLTGCLEEDSLNVEEKEVDELTSELDIYIDENFVQEYNVAVRYRFVDNYIQPDERVSPALLEMVRPMLDFVEDYWIQPYLDVDSGEEFFRRYVPAELIFLGGLIFNGDGTATLGTADAGARITFANVNGYDLSDPDWIALQLNVTYHEFAHIVHQEFSLPDGFENISPAGYTSAGGWFNLTDEEALERGFVSPYGTSSINEDYAELVSFYMFEPDFFETYIDIEECEDIDCVNRNAGRELLFEKLAMIKAHYFKVTGVDLDELRAAVQSRL